jgi:hypothetical protein
MAAWHVWLKSLGAAIWQEAPKAILNLVPFGENIARIAERMWQGLREAQPPEKDKAALEGLVNASPAEVAVEAEAVAKAVAPEASPEVWRTLALTLTTAAPTSRRVLTRPEDSTGRTVPASFRLTGPQSIGSFIPPGPPRFREGQTLKTG